MTVLLLLTFFLLLGTLAAWLGADSRDCDANDTRGWWPAAGRTGRPRAR